MTTEHIFGWSAAIAIIFGVFFGLAATANAPSNDSLAAKNTMDEDAYNMALAQYEVKSTEKEKAESLVSHYNTIVSERKASFVEPTQPPLVPNLPANVAELQAMVRELMAKNN